MLNKTCLSLVLCLLCLNILKAQIDSSKSSLPNYQSPPHYDYKNPEQFHKFYNTRFVVGEWQIHSLKTGALVVRLKTNTLQVNALIQSGNKRLAEKKRLELLARNINTSRAYRKLYNFSKLYFIYYTSSDTLLKGARKNIFLDSNLVVDSNIVMTESFYLIAETDNLYNSTIGFVPESDAKLQKETGTKTITDALCVVKNKYGHQLKKPFPYKAYDIPPLKPPFYIFINAAPILYDFYGGKGQKKRDVYIYENTVLELEIEKDFSYKKYLMHVGTLNENLNKFYKSSAQFKAKDIDPKLNVFLY